MRRLPVYFLLDVSESMIGSPLRQLESGMEQIVRSLRTDPQALETVHLSVIVFAGKSDVIVPMIDVISFYPPRLPVGSGTALGDALNCLMDCIDRDVVQTTHERRGDWKPVCFLLTDGKPTDKTQDAIERWQSSFAKRAQMVAITIGENADTEVLSQITDTVLNFDANDAKVFKQFIDWVSNSVTATSHAVDSHGEGISLAKKPTGLTLIKSTPAHTAGNIDDSVVVLTGRCQKSKRPYLIKYNQDPDFTFGGHDYFLDGAFAIEESFFAWSAAGNYNQQVNTEKLKGVPPCPHCGNATAFAMCACGNLLCINEPGPFVCPWCDRESSFDSEGSGGFDVARGRG